MPFEFHNAGLEPVVRIVPRVFKDRRGSFLETYDRDSFERTDFRAPVELAYYSTSRENVLRGLHLQGPPARQGKVVRCIEGRVFDVMVDIRPGSDSFGEWISFELSQANKEAVFVPRGFAHGFYVEEGPAVVHYLLDAGYAPEAEWGIRWDDATLDIPWPTDEEPILSKKDNSLPSLNEQIEAGRTHPSEEKEGG